MRRRSNFINERSARGMLPSPRNFVFIATRDGSHTIRSDVRWGSIANLHKSAVLHTAKPESLVG